MLNGTIHFFSEEEGVKAQRELSKCCIFVLVFLSGSSVDRLWTEECGEWVAEVKEEAHLNGSYSKTTNSNSGLKV